MKMLDIHEDVEHSYGQLTMVRNTHCDFQSMFRIITEKFDNIQINESTIISGEKNVKMSQHKIKHTNC